MKIGAQAVRFIGFEAQLLGFEPQAVYFGLKACVFRRQTLAAEQPVPGLRRLLDRV